MTFCIILERIKVINSIQLQHSCTFILTWRCGSSSTVLVTPTVLTRVFVLKLNDTNQTLFMDPIRRAHLTSFPNITPSRTFLCMLFPNITQSIFPILSPGGWLIRQQCQHHRKPLYQYRGTGIVVFYALDKIT